MSCYHPLKAIDYGIADPSTGKHSIRILKGAYDPSEIPVGYPDVKYIPIPCGRCIGCRLKYSRDWADRCMLEAQYHEHNVFLTLTYDDSHLPECQEGSPVHPLVKRDLQLFIKRLRKEFSNERIRYFACGEYGSLSMRPHYHLIIFGLHLRDLQLHKRNIDNGTSYFVSPTISRLWNYGFHLITDVTWETCAYTARYVMKKQKGKNASIYDDLNFPPEFTLMSRKPGIARQFYEDHNDIVKREYYITTKNGHKSIRSNRYFDKCFDIDYPNDLEFIKQDRQEIAKKNQLLKSNLTSLSYQELLEAAEENKIASTKVLKRKEV